MNYERASVKGILERVKAEGRTALTPSEGRQLCEAYGIPVPKEGLAASAEDQHLFRQFGATLCNGRLEVQQRFGERTRSCVGMRASGHSHQ